jgi:uncharacterized protein
MSGAQKKGPASSWENRLKQIFLSQPAYRAAIENYIRANALPVDKFSHQARLYHWALTLAEVKPFDDDILHAAAWMHDIGVFVGHRPEEPEALAKWDNVAYAIRETPAILKRFGFPEDKILGVIEAISSHLPSSNPSSIEGVLLRDADILEQLGAVGILRMVSKIGRDTRYPRFKDVLVVLKRNAEELPGKLKLDFARRLAAPRVKALKEFLAAAELEAAGMGL